jgi:hypothetical protein
MFRSLPGRSAAVSQWRGGRVRRWGYGFAGTTIGKRVRELRDEMEKRDAKCDAKMAEMKVDYMKSIGDLTSRLREIEDRAFYGM